MNGPVMSRRSLVAGGVGVAALLALGGGATLAWATDRQALRPPGGQDAQRMLGLCIRCDRCRQACPMDVIVSSGVEDGLVSIRAPKLNFRSRAVTRTLGTTEYHEVSTGYCDFCDPDKIGGQQKKCVAACPTGALQPFEELVDRIGIAVIDPVFCINYPQMGQTPTGCRVCVDACPYGAISLSAEQRPQVDAAVCNGCGKCELVCPSASYRQLIGESTLKERAAAGDANYAASLAQYQRTGAIPRGINVQPA